MNENQNTSGNLLDTTDCLEAVGVFKGWKNFFFIILVLCIAILQACFWLVDLGMIPITPAGSEVTAPNVSTSTLNTSIAPGSSESTQSASQEPNNSPGTVITPAPNEALSPEKTPETTNPAVPSGAIESNQPAEPNQEAETSSPIMLAAETTVPAANEPSQEAPAIKQFLFGITFDHVIWIMRFVNAIFVLIAVLYCLTMMFSLKVSMLGRLGGINHITRGFFLSLVMLILVLPWQLIFDNHVMGAIFTSSELVKWQAEKTGDMMDMILYYLRFCGYMVLVFLLLILAQIRSSRWAKAILRRLEII
jgi:hypothetical protein